MSGEHDRGLHLFHHHKKEQEPQVADDGSVFVQTTEVDYSAQQTEDGVTTARHEVKEHKRHAHLGEAAALGAGAYALYEKHQAKKDPEHAHRHKLEEEIAGAAAVGAGGYVWHEHHEKKDAKKQEKEAEGGKKHHFF